MNNLDRALFAELDKVTKKYVNSIDDILNEYRAIGFGGYVRYRVSA